MKYKLKTKLENKCGTHGYVKKDSVKIIQRSYGKFKLIDNRCVLLYDIIYSIDSIYPLKSDILECVISNSTKMGCIAYMEHKNEEYTLKTSPLLIIIPMNYIEREYKPNERINVEVITSKIKYNAKQIQVIAKPID